LSGVELGSEIVTFLLTVMGALGPTMPYINKLRTKLSAIGTLLEQIDVALADNKITPAEMRAIVKTARKVVS